MRANQYWQRLVPAGLAMLLMAAGGGLRPPIIDATRNGDREALRTLLAEKPEVNAAEADGSSERAIPYHAIMNCLRCLSLMMHPS
jgi:hypothetical protein